MHLPYLLTIKYIYKQKLDPNVFLLCFNSNEEPITFPTVYNRLVTYIVRPGSVLKTLNFF